MIVETIKKTRSKLKLFYYAILFALLIVLIIMMKAYHYEEVSPIMFGYTFFITVFMMSRIMGSFFYKNYTERMSPKQLAILEKGYHPSVSFVIPCKNEEKAIYHTIKSCLMSNYPQDRIEIIAINDGSTDNTLSEMLRVKKDFPDRKVTVVNFKKNRGKREGMAEGFRLSKGEIVVQLDSDSYPDADALQHLVNPFIDKKVGATVGHTDPSNKDENIITKIQTAYYFMSFRALKATESLFDMVFCCSGCFSAYRRAYIMPILDKWLNEKFLGKSIIFGDDRALTNWIIRTDRKTVYIDDAQAYTVVPNTLKKFLKQQTRWKKGWLINSVKIWPEVVKKDKFVAFTYFIPLILVTLITPFIALKALVINPIFFGISPLLYMGGVLVVSCMLMVHYNIYSTDKYGKYMIPYAFLNMLLLSYVMLYALYDLKNMAWGTR